MSYRRPSGFTFLLWTCAIAFLLLRTPEASATTAQTGNCANSNGVSQGIKTEGECYAFAVPHIQLYYPGQTPTRTCYQTTGGGFLNGGCNYTYGIRTVKWTRTAGQTCTAPDVYDPATFTCVTPEPMCDEEEAMAFLQDYSNDTTVARPWQGEVGIESTSFCSSMCEVRITNEVRVVASSNKQLVVRAATAYELVDDDCDAMMADSSAIEIVEYKEFPGSDPDDPDDPEDPDDEGESDDPDPDDPPGGDETVPGTPGTGGGAGSGAVCGGPGLPPCQTKFFGTGTSSGSCNTVPTATDDTMRALIMQEWRGMCATRAGSQLIAEGLGELGEGIGEDLGELGDGIGEDIDDLGTELGEKLDAITNGLGGAEFEGGVLGIDLAPYEDRLATAKTHFLDSIDFIRTQSASIFGTVNLNGPAPELPCIEFNALGRDYSVCFDDYTATLSQIGNLLLFMAQCMCFFWLTKKD